MKKWKKYVEKPARCPEGYAVRIRDGISPFSNVLEEYKVESHEAAFQIYRQLMKDMGRGF